MDVFVVLCPDGVLSYEDMKQCQDERWVPIATLHEGEQVVVICFTDCEVARTFGRRNYPKDWVKGVIALSAGELNWIVSKGWKLKLHSFPKLYKDCKEFGYEVLEFQSEPNLHMKRV